MSVIGEVCGHRDVTLNLLGQRLSGDLPNREQLVAQSSLLRWQDFQMKPCAIRQWVVELSVLESYFETPWPIFRRRSNPAIVDGSLAPGFSSAGSGRPANADSPDGNLHGISVYESLEFG